MLDAQIAKRFEPFVDTCEDLDIGLKSSFLMSGKITKRRKRKNTTRRLLPQLQAPKRPKQSPASKSRSHSLDPELKQLRSAGAPLHKLATAALRKSHVRMSNILEASKDASLLFNEQAKITNVNAAFERFFGYARNEVIGRPVTAVFPKGLSASPSKPKPSFVSELSRQDWLAGREVSACRKDGTRLQMAVRLAPINTPEGRAVLASISDLVRRRVQVERALHESEERLRLALRSTHVAIWEWNVDTNLLTWAPNEENVLGVEPERIRRYENFAELVHRDDLAHFEAERDKAVQNHTPFVVQFRIFRLSGEIRWVSANGRAYYDRSGKPVRVLGTIRDITDRQRADAAMRESEARFHNVFEYAATGIAITDLQGRFEHCNPAYCALLGYSEEELRQLSKADLIHPDDRTANLRAMQRLKARELPFFETENRYLRKDGRTVWVRKFVSTLPDVSGRPVSLMALITDVTERKHVEQELQSSQDELRLRKDQLQDLTTKLFTAQDEERRRIARELHDDFSQRLAALLLELGSLEQQPPVLPELIPRALEPVRIELEQLTEDIHNLAHKLHPTILNDAGLLAAIQEHIHKVGQRTGLRIVLKTRHVPQAIPQDMATCLFRVLQESLQNIVKHANATEVLVRLTGGPKGIGLSVVDNGTGFDAADKIAHQKGLGLASMHERLRYLNGFLHIHSRPADGTKVCAWIPSDEGR